MKQKSWTGATLPICAQPSSSSAAAGVWGLERGGFALLLLLGQGLVRAGQDGAAGLGQGLRHYHSVTHHGHLPLAALCPATVAAAEAPAVHGDPGSCQWWGDAVCLHSAG